MKVIIEGTGEEIKKILQVISVSEEYKLDVNENTSCSVHKNDFQHQSVKNHEQKCCLCGNPALLQISENRFICDDCAQIQGELAAEKSN